MDYHKVIFIHKNPGDPMDTVDKAVNKYHCDAIAYCVLDGEKPMNLLPVLSTDKWLPAILKHAAGKCGVFAYHKIHGSDPAKEAQKLINRIKPYWRQLAGVMVYIKPDYNQSGNSAYVYMTAIRSAFPGMRVDLICHEWKSPSVPWVELLMRTDHVWVIGTGTHDAALWRSYGKAWLWIMGVRRTIPIYPVMAICDIPALGYKAVIDKLKAFWNSALAEKDTLAAGIWNWYPEDAGVVRITMDGDKPAKIRQLLEWMRWTKPTPPPVVPPVEPPVIVPVEPSATDKLNTMWAYGKAQGWW